LVPEQRIEIGKMSYLLRAQRLPPQDPAQAAARTQQ